MKRSSSKDFLATAELLAESSNTPKVKYQNPDGWREP